MAEPVRRVRGPTFGPEPQSAIQILPEARSADGIPRGAGRYPGEELQVWVDSSRDSR